MQIGQDLAAQIGPPLTGLNETAAALGISATAVRKAECRALYKIAMRMRELNLNDL